MSTDLVEPTATGVRAVSKSRRGAAARALSLFAGRLSAGTLVLQLPSGEIYEQCGPLPGPTASVVFARWRALRRLVTRGDLGFAEGYMEGDWTTPDLAGLLRWAHANEQALDSAWGGTRLQRLFNRLRHIGRANTRAGSRRNIAAHYDLGNDFYASWLDESMNYSSGLYRDGVESLAAAQAAKMDRAIELLDIPPGGSVLEIGCGWGALAERMMTQRDCSVTGLTLSREQLKMAAARVSRCGPRGRSKILLKDYRDMSDTFDRIVSIEMIEAAGEKYWPQYFAKLRACLKPGGSAVLQVITIEKPRFEDYRRRPDFIQHYIFPGGILPTVGHMETLSRDQGLTLDHVELFGQSYARTLNAWRKRFLDAWPSMHGAVASRKFRNMWEYYLAYCEVGFENRAIDVGLYRLRRA